MSQYYIYPNYGDYQKYSIYQKYDIGCPVPSLSAQNLYKEQKEQLSKEYSQNRGNPEEAIQIQNFLNTLGAIDKNGNQIEEGNRERISARSSIINEIEKKCGISVTDSLTVADVSRGEFLQLKKDFDEDFSEALENLRIVLSKKRGAISIQTLNRAVKDLQTALNKADPSAKNYKAFKSLVKKIVRMLNTIENESKQNEPQKNSNKKWLSDQKYHYDGKVINFKVQKKSIYFAEGQGKISEGAKAFIEDINKAYSYLTTGSLMATIGMIGELFGASAIALYYGKMNEAIKQFEGVLVGDQKSAKLHVAFDGYEELADLGKGKKKKTTLKGDDGQHYYYINFTDDKVDFEIRPKGDSSTDQVPIKFSMKNYSQDSEVTLLSGSLQPLLAEYPIFLFHMLNILPQHNDYNASDTDKNIIARAAKMTVYVKALAGGVKVLNKDRKIIKNAAADYFVFHNIRRAQDSSFTVLDIKSMIETLIDATKNNQFEAFSTDPDFIGDISSYHMDDSGARGNTLKLLKMIDTSIHVQFNLNAYIRNLKSSKEENLTQ